MTNPTQSSSQSQQVDSTSLDPSAWAADLRTLRELRDSRRMALEAGREEWYTAQVARLESLGLQGQVERYAREVGVYIRQALSGVAAQGGSSLVVHLLRGESTQGWRFAEYIGDSEVRHRVWDLSMDVEQHQTRIRAASIIQKLIEEGGGKCQIVRYPANCQDCFLEALQLKVALGEAAL
jgi:hypothetical protein